MAGSAEPQVSCKYGQASKFGEWRNNYHGLVDGKAVGMTLAFHGTEVVGQVFVAPDFKDISVKGDVDGKGNMRLTTDGGTNSFIGNFADPSDCGKLTGHWSSPVTSIPVDNWFLQEVDAISVKEGANYYSGIDQPNDGVLDASALQLQKAILANNRQAVVNSATYPLLVTFRDVPGKTMIHTPKELLAIYDRVFNPLMLKDISESIPHHMFAKDDKALFTSTIWLTNDGKLSFIEVMGEPFPRQVGTK